MMLFINKNIMKLKIFVMTFLLMYQNCFILIFIVVE